MKRLLLFLLVVPFTLLYSQWQYPSSPTNREMWCIRAVNDSVVWSGGIVGAVIKSTDGGNNWIQTAAVPETNFRSYAIDAINSSTAWVTGTDEGTRNYAKIFKTTNGGTSWALKYNQGGGNGFGIRFFDENNGLAFGGPIDDNWMIVTTTDGGETWTQIPEANFPPPDSTLVIDSEDSSSYYTYSEYGVVDLETYGDHAWFVSYIQFDDPVGKPSYVYHSTDRGYHWTKSTVNFPNNISDLANVAFKDANNGVIVGCNYGTRGHTTDGGATWAFIESANDYFYSVTNIDSTDIYIAVGDSLTTHITYDGGHTWKRYCPSSSSYFFGADATHDKVWACGSSGMVAIWDNFVSLPVELTLFTALTNGSRVTLNWHTATEMNNYGFEVERRELQNSEWKNIGFIQGAGTSNAPKEYTYTDATCFVGNYVYRLKQINTDGTFKYSQSVEVSIQTPNQFLLSQNYPNPFNPTTTIEFTLAEDAFTTLKVYDIIGREVVTLVNENLQAGVLHQATLNANKLSSGMYFYRLESGRQTQVKKLILLK
jgi:photosystem II stability/assembly factor-like uncharacterized protein